MVGSHICNNQYHHISWIIMNVLITCVQWLRPKNRRKIRSILHVLKLKIPIGIQSDNCPISHIHSKYMRKSYNEQLLKIIEIDSKCLKYVIESIPLYIYISNEQQWAIWGQCRAHMVQWNRIKSKISLNIGFNNKFTKSNNGNLVSSRHCQFIVW